jgi:23S rRNA G2445 N2-methylase RlmL
MRMFVTCVPGLVPIVKRELESIAGIDVTDSGFDGRAAVVFFDAGALGIRKALGLRTADDVFVEIARTSRSADDNPRWIAGRLWREDRVGRALAVWRACARPRSTPITFRVIARVLQERPFLRSELRREVVRAIRADQPLWKTADPAQLEVWAIEARRGRLVAGLRLSDVRMRQHGGRAVERRGALRPAVAAAMVSLAGEPSGTLLDPCCGGGTILIEALAAGWNAAGADVSPSAVRAARRNVPRATVHVGDARRIDLPDGAVAACVSNPPFGRQFSVPGDMRDWLRDLLCELARVTRSGGRVVLLAPDAQRASMPAELRLQEKLPVRLLGVKTAIWAFDRR